MNAVPRISGRAGGQQGLALFFSLIMLLLVTLVSVTAFRIGGNQAVVVANAQHRNEGIDAAQEAISLVLNSANFTHNPQSAIPAGNCDGSANNWCVDSNGDGTNDFTVSLNPLPTCITALFILQSQLDFSQSNDLACATGTQQNFGVAGSTSGNSLCANSLWEVSAQAVDTATATTVAVTQGARVRIAAVDMTNSCP